MKRNLITQIKNEWRENLWLLIELVIVSVAVWYLAFSLSTTLKPKFETKGFDIRNVYRLNIKTVPADSPDFIDMGQDSESALLADMRALMRRIRRSPYVEAAAFSSNALPYQYNYIGHELAVVGSDDSIKYQGNIRMGSPEIVRVIRPESVDGVSLDEMEDQLRKNGMLISLQDNHYSVHRNVRDLAGKRVIIYNNSTHPRNVAGFIESLRRTEYENIIGTILCGFDENEDAYLRSIYEIAVRVKPGMQKKFEEEFYSDPDMRRLRNVYLNGLTSMSDVRTATQYSKDTDVRLVAFGILFLLIIIFLGLLGTFWFRIRIRRGEIALRKTCGATRADIFRRTVSEGLLLLGIATVPATAIEAILYFKVLTGGYHDYFKWYGITALAITLLLMSVIIIAGTTFPARKAMKIEPASALKDE